MSFRWQMDKQTVVHPYSEVPLSNKKESATGMSNNGDRLKGIMLSESQTPKAPYCCFHLHFGKRKQMRGFQGLGVGGRD